MPTEPTHRPSESASTQSAPIDQVREWKIFAFLVSALAVALAFELIWTRVHG